MTKEQVKTFTKGVKATLAKRSPEILTGLGIAGMVTTTVLAVKATPKALVLMDDRKQDLEVEKLPPVEVVKTTWKCYVPAVVTGAASTACLIGASSISTRRTAALATAYQLSKTALAEFTEATAEVVGEKKEKVIRDKIAEKQIKNNPSSNHEVIVKAKGGDTRCFDYHSGRYFTSDPETIKRAVNEVNRRMVTQMFVSLNEFYNELELDYSRQGDDLGWTLDDGLLEIHFSSQVDNDDVPCLVLNYNIAPKYGYSSFM